MDDCQPCLSGAREKIGQLLASVPMPPPPRPPTDQQPFHLLPHERPSSASAAAAAAVNNAPSPSDDGSASTFSAFVGRESSSTSRAASAASTRAGGGGDFGRKTVSSNAFDFDTMAYRDIAGASSTSRVPYRQHDRFLSTPDHDKTIESYASSAAYTGGRYAAIDDEIAKRRTAFTSNGGGDASNASNVEEGSGDASGR